MKKSFDATPSDAALRAEDGWVDMDVRWLLTRESVGAEHSVFGITVFPPGSKHDIHRHPNAEEFEYLVSGRGIARVGDADVELGPGEVVFVPKNDYHGFENTGDEPVFMIWGYAGAASLDEAGTSATSTTSRTSTGSGLDSWRHEYLAGRPALGERPKPLFHERLERDPRACCDLRDVASGEQLGGPRECRNRIRGRRS